MNLFYDATSSTGKPRQFLYSIIQNGAMMDHPVFLLEKALAYADQSGIDYDICNPQLDCVINHVLPLLRHGRVLGYIRMAPKGEMVFEYADRQQQATRLLKAA